MADILNSAIFDLAILDLVRSLSELIDWLNQFTQTQS